MSTQSTRFIRTYFFYRLLCILSLTSQELPVSFIHSWPYPSKRLLRTSNDIALSIVFNDGPQVKGINFYQSSSPVMVAPTLCPIIYVASSGHLSIVIVDITNAFQNTWNHCLSYPVHHLVQVPFPSNTHLSCPWCTLHHVHLFCHEMH